MQDSITIDCDDCVTGKISQRIHQKSRFNEDDSEECLAIDFHDFKQDFDE